MNTARQLARVDQLVLTTELLDLAVALAPDTLLRSLDAIHLAAASMVGDDLRAIVTYDHRMIEAGEALGFTIEGPQ